MARFVDACSLTGVNRDVNEDVVVVEAGTDEDVVVTGVEEVEAKGAGVAATTLAPVSVEPGWQAP